MRLSAIERFTIRTLLTPLPTPYASRARWSSRGQAVRVDASHPRRDVGDDLLAADHENHVAAARNDRSEVAAARRGDEQRTLLGDRVRATDDVAGQRGEVPHLLLLHRAIHLIQPQAQRLIAAGPFDVLCDADGLERERLAVQRPTVATAARGVDVGAGPRT
jgi:hypothetical protein